MWHMVSTLGTPAIVCFLEQDDHKKSVATKIPQDADWHQSTRVYKIWCLFYKIMTLIM